MELKSALHELLVQQIFNSKNNDDIESLAAIKNNLHLLQLADVKFVQSCIFAENLKPLKRFCEQHKFTSQEPEQRPEVSFIKTQGETTVYKNEDSTIKIKENIANVFDKFGRKILEVEMISDDK